MKVSVLKLTMDQFQSYIHNHFSMRSSVSKVKLSLIRAESHHPALFNKVYRLLTSRRWTPDSSTAGSTRDCQSLVDKTWRAEQSTQDATTLYAWGNYTWEVAAVEGACVHLLCFGCFRRVSVKLLVESRPQERRGKPGNEGFVFHSQRNIELDGLEWMCTADGIPLREIASTGWWSREYWASGASYRGR